MDNVAYILRDGRNWDNPRIRFVTTDKALADMALDKAHRFQYAKSIRDRESMVKFYKEKLEMFSYMPEDKLTEDMKRDIEEYTAKVVHEQTLADETYEDWRENFKYFDWFVDEAPLCSIWLECEVIMNGILV